MGHIHPHLEAKVIDPVTQGILAPGEVGELCVRGGANSLLLRSLFGMDGRMAGLSEMTRSIDS